MLVAADQLHFGCHGSVFELRLRVRMCLLGKAGAHDVSGVMSEGQTIVGLCLILVLPAPMHVRLNPAAAANDCLLSLLLVHSLWQLITDVTEEAAKYGSVKGVAVPPPPPTITTIEPARVFIQYSSAEESEAAKAIFHGRTFDDNAVSARYVSEMDFVSASAGVWDAGALPATSMAGAHHEQMLLCHSCPYFCETICLGLLCFA